VFAHCHDRRGAAVDPIPDQRERSLSELIEGAVMEDEQDEQQALSRRLIHVTELAERELLTVTKANLDVVFEAQDRYKEVRENAGLMLREAKLRRGSDGWALWLGEVGISQRYADDLIRLAEYSLDGGEPDGFYIAI
jgi:hypothetical protein